MKLCDDTLSTVSVQKPEYDRNKVESGIVHLGPGAFHRAHQAVFVDDILARDPSWGIIGASLRSDAAANALNPQNGLYSVITRSGTTEKCRVIGSLKQVICAPDDPAALIAQMAAPSVRIVSLTITEKGYCRDAIGTDVDLKSPDIQHDLGNPDRPRSAPGFLVAALARRKAAGAGPFTVLSCDNLPHNGQIARHVVTGLARRIDPDLADWIDGSVTFPSSMVDRIVPATTKQDRACAKKHLGMVDEWPVMTEPFGQWVIEDQFCAGRPPFDDRAVILTGDVHPFETMKLRLLNGSHSALAYLGLLRGHSTVAEAVNDPSIGNFVKRLMVDEISPCINVPPDIDLAQYRDDLMERFRNPALNHALLQIATDGSQKLPQRILNSIRDRMAADESYDCLARVIAAWLQFIFARGPNGYLFVLDDPLATELRGSANAPHSPLTVLKNRQIFGDLAQSVPFRDSVQTALGTIASISNAASFFGPQC